jgi:hypothetical protein
MGVCVFLIYWEGLGTFKQDYKKWPRNQACELGLLHHGKFFL